MRVGGRHAPMTGTRPLVAVLLRGAVALGLGVATLLAFVVVYFSSFLDVGTYRDPIKPLELHLGVPLHDAVAWLGTATLVACVLALVLGVLRSRWSVLAYALTAVAWLPVAGTAIAGPILRVGLPAKEVAALVALQVLPLVLCGVCGVVAALSAHGGPSPPG